MQVENVALILCDINTDPGLYLTHELIFTHAWLPRAAFDEVVERDLLQDGRPVDRGDDPRYGNPYAEDPFPGETVRFEHNGRRLELDGLTGERGADSFLAG